MMTLYRVTVTVPPDAPANVSRREFERQFLTTFTELEPLVAECRAMAFHIHWAVDQALTSNAIMNEMRRLADAK